ncbi:DHA2 family efflux MFS transporter permease subunit [Lentilactobacillus kefiri]|nr:DHA2 family efflux MFS transporter permease subunit [Lentilactobacillus kefiri]KRL69273.1 transport protein [Lentilactobacillus parakefiri DSM 10551]MCJ2162135.1 DHA2 family efflux MFS transporter permease subunit [Lentilactobacillus kefiri]MCP9369301.1 DHA2 family efflux MFS transporter permease subunit [Lentilactobacillus kefiri]MDH5108763.1 DHA2 family efflux MFS transporter permease subunit [Lentilactobacillus kefiri]MDM7493206.1 DHA2 family efflux MFS transporter permease subunit [Lent
MTRKISTKLYLSIVATGLMAFCGVLIETAMNVTFPTLMTQFNVDTATIQWLTTGYLLVVSIIVPISGVLKRRFTTMQLFLTASAFFIVGLLICTLANRFDVLLIGRIIQGLGTGIALPLMFNIILEQAPLDKIGLLMGIGTLVTAIAPALGPTYGGLLIGLNWHAIFGILLAIMVIALFLGIFSITQVSKTVKVRLDFPSWIAIAIFFAGAILGLNNIEASLTTASIYGLIGIIGLIGFIVRSKHIDDPIIRLNVFKNKSFDLHVVSFVVFQIMNVGVAFVLPNYLQIVAHTSSLTAGLLLLPGAALGAILAPVSGTIYDRLGPTKPITIALVFQTMGLIVLLVEALSASPVSQLIGYILMMLGTGFGMSTIITNGLAQIPKAENVDGNAVFNTLQQFAGAFGTAVISMVVALAQVKTDYVHTTAVGAQHAFIVLMVLEVVNIICIFTGLHFDKSRNQDQDASN